MGLFGSLIITLIYAGLSIKHQDPFVISVFIIFLTVTSIILLRLRSLKRSKEWGRQTMRYREYRWRSVNYPRRTRIIMDFPDEMIESIRKK